MSKIFQYDQQTWPDIDHLPRATPLIIPLGSGYSFDQLEGALDYPDQMGILPVFPYGWAGSCASLPINILEACLHNLVESLEDDGFTRVYILAPHGLDLVGPNGNKLLLDRVIYLPNTTEEQTIIPVYTDRDKVVLIPIGHTEQHAYHLPMSTDTLIIDAIAQGVVEAIPNLATRLPVMPYGVSTHREAFAGTLNMGGRAFEDFYLATIDHLVDRGFDRFYLISGHGGNSSFLVNVVKFAGEKHRRIFCATAWLYLSGPEGIAALEQHRRSNIGGMGHACELETSLMLHLNPDLVHMDKVVDETDYISTPSYYMDWVEGGALVANPPWDDDTRTGAYGAGSLATASNGAIWLEAAIREKVTHIDEIHEQQRRREERRSSGYGRWGLQRSEE